MGKPVGSVQDLRQLAADPGAPGAGITSLYSKSDSGLYIQSSVLAELRLLTDADAAGGENLLDNSSFENASSGGGQVGTAGRFSLDTTQFVSGTQSLKIAPLAGDTGNIGWQSNFKSIGVADGLTFVLSASLRRAAGTGNFRMSVVFADAALTTLQTYSAVPDSNSTASPAGSWVRRASTDATSGVVITAPVNARNVRVQLFYTSYVGGTDVMNIDHLQFQRGTVPTDYQPPPGDRQGGKIQNLADPTAAQDAVTKNYGDLNYNSITAAQITALTAAAAGAGTDELPVNEAGTAKKLTLTQLQTWLSITSAQITALAAVTTPAGTDVLPVSQGGTAKKLTLSQINAYTEPVSNSSNAQQVINAAVAYVDGSMCTIDPTRLQARSFYRCRIRVSKTAAGTNAPVVQVRMGTAGTTADTAQILINLAAQTAVADEGKFEILVNFRTVGASTVMEAEVSLWHRLATTGLNSTATFTSTVLASAAFDSTTFTKLGVCLNPGTLGVWTLDVVQADILNIL
jgi:hypothetical protein